MVVLTHQYNYACFYLNHHSLVYSSISVTRLPLCFFSSPNPLRDLTLTSEGQTFRDKEHSCPPTSLVSHSCFGSGLGTFSRFSSLSGPGKDTTKGGQKHSHRVRRPPHQHPPPLAQQMTSVETVELTHIDCLLQMVF